MKTIQQFVLYNRRRIAQLCVILFILLVIAQFWPHLPSETDLEFVLGPLHQQIVEVQVTFIVEGQSVRGATFHFPQGAPPKVRHRVDLTPGDYQIQLEIHPNKGQRQTIRSGLKVPAQGVVIVRIPPQQM